MRRVGNVFDSICEPENLRLAFLKACRGKRHKTAQRAYSENLDDNLVRLREGLLGLNYPIGNYIRFTVYDPKEREICAATFSERVLHHALMNVCGPWFDKWLIHDSYACRIGKGQLKAVARAQVFARRYPWFLKADIRKFFDSVPHDRLMSLLTRKFKDQRLLAWFEKIIGAYETEAGYGLPIGNLTSQYFANLFLDPLDRLCAQKFPYVRYMDDFAIWANTKDALKAMRGEIVTFVRERLGLEVKNEPFINQTARGMDFLGMRVFPHVMRLSRQSAVRFRKKAGRYAHAFSEGCWTERQYQERITALTAFVCQANTLAFRRKVFGESAANVGLEPEHPWRELEQQRQQPALRVLEQQHAIKRQQQQRVPGCAALSTTRKPEGRTGSPQASCSRVSVRDKDESHCPSLVADANAAGFFIVKEGQYATV